MIVNLKVSNFKGIENAEVECKKVTLFVGDNRQGKTSLLTSIGWCIDGSPKPYYVKHGKDETTVIAETEKAIFKRNYVRGSKKDKITIIKKSDGSLVDPKFALTAFNSYCFDPMKFIFLDPKTQSKVIREALANKMTLTEEEVKQYKIITHDSDGIKINNDAKTLCEDTYKRYYSDRTEINRQVDLIKKKMESVKLDFIPDAEYLQQLEKQIEELSGKLTKQVMHNAQIKAAKDNEVTYQKLSNQLEKIKEEIDSCKIDEEQSNEPIEELESRFKVKTSEESELRSRVKSLKKSASDLSSNGKIICPISKNVICTTDIEPYKKQIQEELEVETEKLKQLYSSNMELSEQIEKIKKQNNTRNNLKMKQLEYDRTKAMLENLNITQSQPEDESSTRESINVKQKELATVRLAKELVELGDYEEKMKLQKELDGLVKALRVFIDNELTKRANLNINDIEIKEDGLYFRNLPLSEECTSIQLRASCAIIKSLFPKSKLILTDKLEALGKKNLVTFLKNYVNEDNDTQLFGTYVSDDEDFSFLKSVNGVQVVYVKSGVPTIL